MDTTTRLLGYGVLALLAFMHPACEFDRTTGPDDSESAFRRQENTLHFKHIRARLSKPSRVQFDFSLRDRDWHPVLVSPAEIKSRVRILEDGASIDTTETNFFVDSIPRDQLELALVLDYTHSMTLWQENGSSGIESMTREAKRLLDSLPAPHRVAIVEFHDRFVQPGVLSGFTPDKRAAVSAIDQFMSSGFDYGASRCWDALYTALSLFPEGASPEEPRILLLITDGFDTSSKHTTAEVVKLAGERGVAIHAIDTGALSNTKILEPVAHQTAGGYYVAKEVPALGQHVNTLIRDFQRQYQVSYVTLKIAGKHDVQIALEWDNETNWFAQELDLGSVYADDRVGEITVDPAEVIDRRAMVPFRARHLPRNIDRFRLRIGNRVPTQIAPLGAQDGGLCEGWQSSGPDSANYYEVFSPTGVALPFGASGLLFEAVFEGLKETGLILTCEFDTTIYPSGKRFVYPETLYVGLPILDPAPPDSATQVPATGTQLSWRVNDPRHLSLTFDVLLDTLDASTPIQTGLRTTSLSLPHELVHGKMYFWRVVAHASGRAFAGPRWCFQTNGQ